MGLFRKAKHASSGVRSGNCLYNGEPFPRRGEAIDVGGRVYEWILDQDQLPGSWTGLVEVIRQRTGEPPDRRVYRNILGTMMPMVELKLQTFGEVAEDLGASSAQRDALRAGNDSIAKTREPFRVIDGRGDVYFDFEVIKIASMLASSVAASGRASSGWPEPELWSGELSAFSFPGLSD